MRIAGEERTPGSIFTQPWWLDAVAPGAWHEARVVRGGQLFARMPYLIQKKGRFIYSQMPFLTQTLGPWLRPYSGKYTNRLSEEKELMTELIHQLPPFDVFVQNFHHSITNWLPFYWCGFEQTTRYTYLLRSLDNLEAIFAGIRSNIKGDIRKAQKQLCVRDDLSLDHFFPLHEKVFSRQDRTLAYTRSQIEILDAACVQHGCRKIFFAEDAQKRLHAAVYIVWDDQTAYYLMSGSDPELRNSGATSLLLWEAIRFAASVTQSFDFEGSMIEPVERFFRAFGAEQVPYFQVRRTNSLLSKIDSDVRSWLRLWRDPKCPPPTD